MATYIQGLTDFVPDIQPFQPDWGTIDKTLRLKQGRYDQGYSNIQNTYSGLLNMPQLKQDQIDKRDKFLKQAFDKIGNLATVDLSLPENVATAQNVFAPLYNDTEFLGNASVSKHYQQQEAYADGLRQRDGGKEFSMDNLNYVRQQKMDYINDTTPDSWKKYYATKRYYEPYYDTKKEIREAMEKFKPSSTSVVRLNGFYKQKTEDSSWRESEIKDYLNSVLSDKAKRQLQIEATVRLGDPSLITALYKENAKKDISQTNSKIDEIDAAIKVTKDPTQRNGLIDIKNQLTSSIQDVQQNLSKIESGDLSYIKDNQERLAYSMYYNSVIGDASRGFSHKDIKEDISEDTVAFGMWKEAQAMKRFMIGEQNEMYRFNEGQNREDRRLAARLSASVDENGNKVKRNDTPIPYDIVAGPDDVANPIGLGDLDSRVQEVKEQGFKDSQDLKVHIAKTLGDLPINKVTGKMVQDYMKSPQGKNDNEVIEFINRSNSRHLVIDDADNTKKQAEAYANRKLGNNFDYDKQYNEFIKKVKNTGTTVKDSYTLVDPETHKTIKITPRQVFEGVQNDNVQVEFFKTFNEGRGFKVIINGHRYNVDEPAGRSYSDRYNNGESLEAIAARSRNSSFTGKDMQKYSKYVNEFFGSQKTELRKGITYPADAPVIKTTKQKISSLAGIDDSKVSEVGYMINSDKNKIYFNINQTKENPIDPQAIADKLTAKGYATTVNPTTGLLEITNSTLDAQLDPFSNIPAYSRQLIATLETRQGKTGSQYQSTYYNLNNKGAKTAYRIDKVFGDNSNSYYLYPSGSNKPVNQRFSSAFDAYKFSIEMAADPSYARIIMQ